MPPIVQPRADGPIEHGLLVGTVAALFARVQLIGMETKDQAPQGPELVGLHRAELKRFLERMIGRQDAAEEVAERAYAQFRLCATAEASQALRALLFDIATQLAIDYLRRQRIAAEIHVGPAPTLPEAALAFRPASLLERRQELIKESARLAGLVEELDPPLRQVFRMRYVLRIPREQIVATLGISAREVERRLQECLSYCRRRLSGSP